MYCSKCGKENSQGANYCVSCGEEIYSQNGHIIKETEVIKKDSDIKLEKLKRRVRLAGTLVLIFGIYMLSISFFVSFSNKIYPLIGILFLLSTGMLFFSPLLILGLRIRQLLDKYIYRYFIIILILLIIVEGFALNSSSPPSLLKLGLWNLFILYIFITLFSAKKLVKSLEFLKSISNVKYKISLLWFWIGLFVLNIALFIYWFWLSNGNVLS